jgi:general L-amino acid transport system permease protein
LLAIVVLAYVAIVLNAFPPPNESWTLGPIAVLNVRGSSMFWFEGRNWKFVVAVVVTLLALWGVARWRRSVADRTGHPARTALWAIPAAVVVLVVSWVVLGLGATAPELDGRRVTGGITMTPSYFAALFALVVYTASHIAEIVRGSIQAVPRGQGEAADALALSGFQRMWFVVLPQAMRIGVPPTGNQYLNLTKNSSLAAVISFPELTKVTQLAVATRAPAVPSYTLLLLVYLALSLLISLVVNFANRRLAIVER